MEEDSLDKSSILKDEFKEEVKVIHLDKHPKMVDLRMEVDLLAA